MNKGLKLKAAQATLLQAKQILDTPAHELIYKEVLNAARSAAKAAEDLYLLAGFLNAVPGSTVSTTPKDSEPGVLTELNLTKYPTHRELSFALNVGTGYFTDVLQRAGISAPLGRVLNDECIAAIAKDLGITITVSK